MDVFLPKSQLSKSEKCIQVSGSKSISNRLLILKALLGDFQMSNLSDSDDTKVLQEALNSQLNTIDVGHAGTAMRFLTAYFATQENRDVVLTGSERMQQRPIGILVNALRQLGAEITYVENEGYPSLRISGKKLSGVSIKVQADISSQYLSALLLIAPTLEKGLTVAFESKVTSRPYLQMTLALLKTCGVSVVEEENAVMVKPFQKKNLPTHFTVESDWSSASYFYSFIALSPVGTALKLRYFKEESLQGDKRLTEIYSHFGVTTSFEGDFITLTKQINHNPKTISVDLTDNPDLAQTIAVTCLGLNVDCHITGLHTLKIKETDRLAALQTELIKFGAKVKITKDSLSMQSTDLTEQNEIVAVATYDDHRMAMAFAPLCLKHSVVIKEATVVTKSYPDFWKDLAYIGVDVNIQ